MTDAVEVVEDNPSSPITQSSVQKSSPKKRPLTSVVWNDFKKFKKNGVELAACNHCGAELKAGSKNGTSHLKVHLNRCPKRKNMDIRQQMLAVEAKKDGTVSFGNFTFDQEASREKLSNMIIKHEYPLSIVDHDGFREFVSSLQPLFKMVTRNTIRSDILEIYEKKKKKVSKLLERNGGRIAITTDMWSSVQKKGYMAVTAHYIDESWILRKLILRFAYVPTPHTKENLSEVLMDTLLDWNIDRKLSTITVDNCTTNDAIIAILKEQLSLNHSLLVDGKIMHMRCCAHILNLIVQDGLKVIKEGIEKVRESVLIWTATPSRVEKFEEAAHQLRIPCLKKLPLDTSNRWNSTYLMLQVAIEYKDVFSRLKQREPWYTCVPSEEDWRLAKEICSRLRLFYNVSDVFSGCKYPTSNLYFTKVCEVRMALREWVQSTFEVIKEMATKMTSKFNKYWSNTSLVMTISVVLDPQYKMKLVEYYYPIIYGSDASEEIKSVCETMKEILIEYKSRSKSVQDHMSIGACSSSVTFPIAEDPDPLVGYDLFVHDSLSNYSVKSELDHYLDEPVLPRTPNFDILSWWKSVGVKYPTLALIARDFLAIPVSTVASESAFSTGGKVVDPERSKLKPGILEALMCTQDWLRNEKVGLTATSSSATLCIDDDSDQRL